MSKTGPPQVLIAGGGIAGLVMGLTLHEIGVSFNIVEAVGAPKPLGVGINLQPPAVRELYALGLADMLETVGVQTQDYGFYTRTGVEIWTEPRGRSAGYRWPQYSVHRGKLQMALLDALIKRCGDGCISFGTRVVGYQQSGQQLSVQMQGPNGQHVVQPRILVGADGIHSAVRAQLYPDEGAPVWGGAIMWRGTSQALPFLSGRSMILAGNDHIRFVCYPISAPDPDTGLAVINWIAELRVDPDTQVEKEDWNRQVSAERFASHFNDWDFGWLNVPELISTAEAVFEYPMVDRDPVDQWTQGHSTLIGDAAHATYPVGSSGASQAILDARILSAQFLRHGVNERAARRYEASVRPKVNEVTLANRGNGGPDAVMQIAQDRCAGDFARLDEVFPMAERAAHAERFKKLAGIGVNDTNMTSSLLGDD